ncbi:MAG: hypothetical protein ACXV76_08875, partial [Halobacteriota archaeon]
KGESHAGNRRNYVPSTNLRIIILGAENYSELFSDVALPDHELLEIHYSRISLHRHAVLQVRGASQLVERFHKSFRQPCLRSRFYSLQVLV